MIIQYIIGGLLSVLTPVVAFWLIFLIIAFNNFRLTTKRYIISLIGFGLVVIGSYVIYGILIPKTADLFLITDSNVVFIVLYTVLYIVFGLWIIGVITIKTNNIVIKQILRMLIVLIIGIVFSYSAISNTDSIFWNIIVSDMSIDGLSSIIIPLTGFAFGLFISVGLILVLTSGLIKKLSEKKWWKIVKVSSGSLFLVLFIIALLLKIK